MTALLVASPTRWKTIDLLSDWDKIQPAWDEFVAAIRKEVFFTPRP